MKHRLSRIPRIGKWKGLVACVVLLLGWVISLVCVTGYWGHRNRVMVISGMISVQRGGVPSNAFWFAYRDLNGPSWLPTVSRGLGNGTSVGLPIWIPFLLIALPTAYLFWRDRRPPRGHCRECGYNLTGNVSGVCPECGGAFSQ